MGNGSGRVEAGPWPKAKLQRWLREVGPDLGRCCVLVSTGALNPVHQGHRHMMDLARQRLTEEGYSVLGGWLSPSHRQYVDGKSRAYGVEAFETEDRVELTRLACASSDWLDVGLYECDERHAHWPDFPSVLKAASLAVQSAIAEAGLIGVTVDVFYVCGEDLYSRSGLDRGLAWWSAELGVVVVSREGEGAAEDPGKKIFAVGIEKAPDTQTFSSTRLREALRRGDLAEITSMLPAGVSAEAVQESFTRAAKRSSAWVVVAQHKET